MNIVYAINKSYTDKLCTNIISILENNKDEFFNFYIMHSSLTDYEKLTFYKLKLRYKNFDIHYLQINKNLFTNLKKNIDYISVETYYRYIIADLLTEDKCLYLDADTIVNGKLKNLYNTNIEEYYCAGVDDLYINIIDYKKELGLTDQLYINAGVILFNLKKIREDKYSEKLFENTVKYEKIIKFQDQDIINITFGNRIKEIDTIYNFCSDNMKQDSHNIKNAVILHYNGPQKPWDKKYKGKCKKIWKKYYDIFNKINQNENNCPKLSFAKKIINKYKSETGCFNILYFLGIKISIPTKEYTTNKKLFNDSKKKHYDITKYPKATGSLRTHQLANLALLKEMDYVCKKANLRYWLDFGTLLGAVRHKGFIPWDDDIDTGMLREDYDKIIDAFRQYSRNPDIYAGYTRAQGNPCQYFIKIQHKKCPYLFIDIFPYDFYGQKLDIDKQLELSEQYKINREIISTNCCFEMDDNFIKTIIDNMKSNNLNNTSKDNKSDLVWGIDFPHLWKNWFTPYDKQFPLKTIEFEGNEFPCANDTNYILEKIFNNYMDYPDKFYNSHNAYIEMTEEEKSVVNNLIRSLEK